MNHSLRLVSLERRRPHAAAATAKRTAHARAVHGIVSDGHYAYGVCKDHHVTFNNPQNPGVPCDADPGDASTVDDAGYADADAEVNGGDAG